MVALDPRWPIGAAMLVTALLVSCSAPLPGSDAGVSGADVGVPTVDGGSPGSDGGGPRGDSGSGPCVDADGDGACASDDCDDTNPARYPGAIERCDTIDQDCNPETLGPDADRDGLAAVDCCNAQSAGSPLCGQDCDDTRDTVKPSALEACNERDDDCDGTVDDGVQLTFYRDVDGDGFGDPAMTVLACVAPAGFVATANVNECAAPVNPCGVGTCTDLPGTYRCSSCPANYVEVTTPAPACVWDSPSLLDLRTNIGALTPAFGAAVTTYVLAIPSDVTAVTLTPTAPVGFAGTLSVQGQGVASGADAVVSLGGMVVDIAIVVRAQSGRAQTYTVRVLRGWSDDAYLKASNTGAGDRFGAAMALSADGNTLAIGAYLEDSDARGVGGNQASNAAPLSGAVYVFRRAGSTWAQEAYVKASNAGQFDGFGRAVALSADGSTMAVGAYRESSSATGVDGNEADDSAGEAGAVYLLRRNGSTWAQVAYLKASNTGASASAGDHFGAALALSADGTTLAVAAPDEGSSATGVGGNQGNDSALGAGAAYVFRAASGTWAQEAYVKASNTGAGDRFGAAVALSGDGSVLAVGADGEDSSATGIGGNQTDDSATAAGAVYVFARTGASWAQQAYVKASNTDSYDVFGNAVALSADGATLAVGASGEASNATGIGGNQADDSAPVAGAVYVFRRGSAWAQEAYLKASNTGEFDAFGSAVALSADGSVLAVGAPREDSSATRVAGNPSDESAADAGALYVLRRVGATWAHDSYIKATNTGADDRFGAALAVSADGRALVVGAPQEDSSALGVAGNQGDNGSSNAGAAYVYRY